MKIQIFTMLLLVVIILASGCASTQDKPNVPTTPTNMSVSRAEMSTLQSANISAETAEYGGGTPSLPGVPAPDPDPAFVMLNNTTYGGGTASIPGVPVPPSGPAYIFVGNNTTTQLENNITAVGNNTTL
jgi:hypothetical protein